MTGAVTAAPGPGLVEPVPAGVVRPQWSVMISTYNGTAYLAEAMRSVLQQDPGPDVMQIEVVDDCSAEGDPEALVADVGAGRVQYFRQPRNVGYIDNFNTCLRRAHGHVVHLLHDDDAVRPGFYERLAVGLAARPDAGAAFCRSIYMDPDGHWDSLTRLEQPEAGVIDDWLWRIATGPRITNPALVARRSTYEVVGGYDSRHRIAGEDWEIWVRIASRFPVWYEPEPLAMYRVRRPGSLSEKSTSTNLLAADMRQAADIIESYLSERLGVEGARRMLNYARADFARWSAEAAGQLLAAGELHEAGERAREALRTRTSPGVVGRLLLALSTAGADVGRRAARRGRRAVRERRRPRTGR